MTSRCLWGLLVLVSALANRGVAQDVYRLPDGPLPVTPPAPAHQLNEFDRTMIREMQDRGTVGGAIAVTRFGRLVYARGFGYANLQNKEPVQPTSLFRIGSMSKTITAVAALQLVQRRKLGLDTAVTGVLNLTPVLEAGREPEQEKGTSLILGRLVRNESLPSRYDPSRSRTTTKDGR